MLSGVLPTKGQSLSINNLSSEIEKQLPSELVEFMQTAGLVAASQGQSLYLVGGLVRDLLLGRTNLDLDLQLIRLSSKILLFRFRELVERQVVGVLD